jgi:hypothetical protein
MTMRNDPILPIIAASLLVISFALMTCFGRDRSIYGIGLVGSLLHLIGTIPWQILHESFLPIDLVGVALVCVAGFWTLGRAMIRRHA